MSNFFYFIIITIAIGCSVEKKNFKARPSITDNLAFNGKIKSNGGYYAIYNNPRDSATELGYFFFYSNGVIIYEHAGPINIDSVNNTESIRRNILRDLAFKKDFFNRREGGGFKISNNEIIVQAFRYIPQLNWSVATFKGRIMNDSVIYISSCDMKKRPDYCRMNFELKFIEMPKPDSVNRYMNRKWYWGK